LAYRRVSRHRVSIASHGMTTSMLLTATGERSGQDHGDDRTAEPVPGAHAASRPGRNKDQYEAVAVGPRLTRPNRRSEDRDRVPR
jgi:cellobiose-specific phosphotransferase system component IIB